MLSQVPNGIHFQSWSQVDDFRSKLRLVCGTQQRQINEAVLAAASVTAQAEHLRAEVPTDEQWDVGWAYTRMNCLFQLLQSDLLIPQMEVTFSALFKGHLWVQTRSL